MAATDPILNSKRERRFLKGAYGAGMLTVVVAAQAIVGWLFDIRFLNSISPNWISMKPNSAIAFLISGLVLIYQLKKTYKKQYSSYKKIACVIVLAIGLATLSEYVFYWNAGIDELLFKDVNIVGSNPPGRMSPMSAIGFIVLGASLFLCDLNNLRLNRVGEYLALIIFFFSIIPCLGYLYSVENLYSISGFTQIPLLTTCLLLTTSLGILFSMTETGLLSVFLKNTRISKLAFRQFIMLSGMAIVTGWLQLEGYRLGYFNTQFALSLTIVFFIGGAFYILWLGTRNLNNAEINQQRLEKESQEKQKLVASLLESAPDGLMGADEKGTLLFVNKMTCTLFGYTQDELVGAKIEMLLPARYAKNHKGLRESYSKNPVTQSMGGKRTDTLFGITKQGREFPVEVGMNSLPTENGLLIIASICDVTKKLELEEKLKLIEERLSATLASIGEGVIATDSHGKVSYINPAAELLTGWTNSEAEGKDFEEIYLIKDEGTREPIASPLNRIIGKGLTITIENHTILRSRDNGQRIISHNGSPIRDKHGKISGAVLVFRDTTEKTNADKKIRQAQEQFNKAFFDNAAPMVISSNSDYRFVEVNRSFEKLTGYSRDELIGKTSVELKMVNPVERKVLAERVKQYGPLKNEEMTLRAKSGVQLSVLYSMELIDVGAESCMLLTHIDLSGLREMENRYRSIFENIQQGIYQSSPDGKILTANPAMAAMFGFSSPCELIVSIEDIATQIYADPLERDRLISLLEKHGQVKGFVLKALTKSKSTIWVRANIHVVKDAIGNINYFEGTLEDITENKKAEKRLLISHRVLENAEAQANLGNWQVDLTSKSIYCSRHLLQMFGLDPTVTSPALEEILQSIHPDDRMMIEEAFNKMVSDQEPVMTDFRTNPAKLTKRFFSPTYRRVSDVEGHSVRFEGTVLDITARQLAEDQLTQQFTELQKTNNELDHFVYSVSHDLRAPLATILGVINVAEMESPSPLFHSRLQMIRVSINKLDGFIRDILNYSHNARLDVKIEEINFAHILDGIKKHLSFMEGINRLSITLHCEGVIPFFSDLMRCSIVLQNLISNAIKFQDFQKSESTLTINITTTTDKAVLYIRDNGLGIHSDHVPRIFEMFYRAADKSNGAGLGLYIVRECVTKMGGSLQVESEPGVFTAFTIALPNRLHDHESLQPIANSVLPPPIQKYL